MNPLPNEREPAEEPRRVADDRPRPPGREAYVRFEPLDTRWSDNDVYGHVNNVVYYSYFDTAVNRHLIEAGVLDPVEGALIGLVVETQCRYFAPLSFPQPIEAGLRVAHIGRSGVRYEIGLFAAHQPLAAAAGHFVHVYVDRRDRRPRPLPPDWLRVLEALRPGCG
jgi:acyl-CoA thioester hydrolase